MRHAVLLGEVAHRVHLILHQGDERAYHNRHSVHQQCRQLVAHTLSSACGHQDKRILPVQKVHYNLFLISLERIKPKMMLQSGNQLIVTQFHP